PSEPGVALRLCDQPRDDPPIRALGDDSDPGAEKREEIAAQRAGAPGPLGSPLGEQDVQRERLLRGPPTVDRRLADPGDVGDLVHADSFEPALEEELRSRAEDRLPRPLAARATTPPRLFGHRRHDNESKPSGQFLVL